MSNALAIAATTATLRHLLDTQMRKVDAALSDLAVTTYPPDVARKSGTPAQLNIFLYQTAINGAWRNLDVPRSVRPGENGAPPLALNLHYLLTAYGRGENDVDAVSHRVLGGAMSVLHDHPVLGRDEILSAAAALPDNGLAEQFERLRITPLALSVEDISKLWTVFQSQYRISTAYEVTVVLIDSRRAVRSALPVLTRGAGDRGVSTVVGGAPVLSEVRPPRSQSAARLGEDLVIAGEQLTSAGATVRFTSLRTGDQVSLPPLGASTSELNVHLPDATEDAQALTRWSAGFYSVALLVTRPDVPAIASNALAVALAPRITIAATHITGDTLQLIMTAEPRIAAGQRVLLLLGDRQVAPSVITTPTADTTQPTTVVFEVDHVVAGTYVVRLRVDGVDSIPVTYTGAVPAFDPAQQVTKP